MSCAVFLVFNTNFLIWIFFTLENMMPIYVWKSKFFEIQRFPLPLPTFKTINSEFAENYFLVFKSSHLISNFVIVRCFREELYSITCFWRLPPSEGGRGRYFTKPQLEGIRASKPMCTPKFMTQTSRLPKLQGRFEWVSEWMHSYICINIRYIFLHLLWCKEMQLVN